MMFSVSSITSHLQENKKYYFVGGTCLIVGVGVGALYMGGGIQIIDAFNFLKWKSPHQSFTVLVRRGHPGNIIKCVETGELFASQNRAAAVTGVNPGQLSSHLNGKFDAAGGLHFEKLGEASAAAVDIAK